MKVYFDTNVLVAALKIEHVHHRNSFRALERVSVGDLDGVVSGQTLAEAYSVLTRTPFRIPVIPQEAVEIFERTIIPAFELIATTTESYRAAIALCAKNGWKGGRIHDAVHLQAAAQAGCDVIYTYDLGHFRSVAGDWAGRIEEPPAV